jgi:TRAP-type C4-dicarboxylate transport system permease small subunit
LNTFKRIMKVINRINAELSGALVFLIALGLIIGYVTRAIGVPLLWVTEFTTYAMIAIVFLGFAIGQEQKGHVRVEMVITYFSKRWWQIVNIFGLLVALVIGGVMLYASWQEALYAIAEKHATSGLVPIPVYPAKAIISFGLLLYVLQLVIDLFQEIKEPSDKPTDV